MVSVEQRVLAAFSDEKSDRIPIMDNALQIFPAMKTLVRFQVWPKFFQKQLIHLYYDLIQAAKENLGMAPLQRRETFLLKILPIDSLLTQFIASPTSPDVKHKIQSLKLYMEAACMLGLDLYSIPIFPSVNVIGTATRTLAGRTQKFLITDDYCLVTVDESGDIKGASVFHDDFLMQIKAHKKALDSIDFEQGLALYQELKKARGLLSRKKFSERIYFSLFLSGFFETWFAIFGFIENSMRDFFRQVFKENKTLKGPYIDLLRYKLKVYNEIIKRISEMGCHVVFLGEDCAIDSGPMIGDPIYKKYFAPLIKGFVDNCHKYDVKVILHTDGRFDSDGWKLLDTIVGTGIDALNPLQSNVTDIRAVRERYPDLCLTGMIDCTNLLQNGTPKEVHQEVARVIKQAGKRRIIVGSDNSIHSGVKIKNYLALSQAVRQYGRL